MEEHDKTGAHYTRTPLVKRLPTVATLALALILARLLGHTIWAGLLILLGTWTVCVVVLRVVFGQPLERLLQYRELHED